MFTKGKKDKRLLKSNTGFDIKVYNKNMLSSDFIKKLKKDTDFQEFLGYIVETIEELDSIDGFDTKAKNEQLGEQLRARVIARDKLHEILRPFIDFVERKEPTKEQLEATKKKFGL